jgi:CRP-like cAMP-binding protein
MMRYWLVKGVDFRQALGEKEITGFRVDILWKEEGKSAQPELPELLADFVYLINRGELELVFQPGTPRALTLARLKAGEIFGVNWKTGDQPDSFLLVPAGEPEIFQIEPEEARRLVEDRKIKLKIRKGFKRMELTQSVRELIRVEPGPRVAALLLKLARGFGQEAGGGVRLSPAITPPVVSELTGLSIEITCLILAGLKRQGMLEIKPEGIAITDRIRLSFLSEAVSSDSKDWP